MVPAKISDADLRALVQMIAAGQSTRVFQMLEAQAGLARARFVIEGATRQEAKAYLLGEIGHYVYKGDTALHIAAAAYQTEIARRLLALGGETRARNRLGAEPLHLAAMGMPGSQHWNPHAQAAIIDCLITAGADPNALDNNGVAPLHRAVRTRCASAVKALLKGGADPRRPNRSGSTPMMLAHLTTGRGGSGSVEAKAQQQEIVALLREAEA